MKANISNMGQIKTVPRANEKMCACVFDRDVKDKAEPKTKRKEETLSF